MKAEELTNPIVRAVVTAMRDGDRKVFFDAFSPSAKLTDDDNSQPLVEWADREIFQSHGRLDVESEPSTISTVEKLKN
jgi:hypothetical protein